MRAILHHRFISENTHPSPEPLPVATRRHASPRRRQAASLTLACNGMFLLINVGVALMFKAIANAAGSLSVTPAEQGAIAWGIPLVLLGPWLYFLGLDTIRASRPSQARRLPFNCTERVVKRLYLRRLEFSLWAIGLSGIFLMLCVLFTGTSLISKLFLVGVVALIIVAVRNSIPFERLSLIIAAGVFAVTLAVISVASALVTPEADLQRIQQTLE